MPLTPEYDAWNAALVEEYFPLGNHGRLAYLPLDDEELEAMAEPYELSAPGEAVDSFVSAVCAELASYDGSFLRFPKLLNGWRKVREEPPYVAALAFCVLAAARMASDVEKGIASSNYYTQLNRLLGKDDRAGQPAGFDKLTDVWQDLARWLDGDCGGSRGQSTIRTARLKHVGYPLSQCLLRAVDRRRLPDFFRAVGLTPETEVSEDRIFTLLRAWATQPSCGLSSPAKAAIERAEDIDRHEIAETVGRELKLWDGELRDARGRRRAEILLFVKPGRGMRSIDMRFIPRRPEGFPRNPDFRDAHGRAFDVRPAPLDGIPYYLPLQHDVTDDRLRHSWALTDGDVSLRLDGDHLHVFHETFEPASGWLASSTARLGEPALVLVHDSYAQEAESLLRGITDTRPRETRPAGLPRGWRLFSDVRIVRTPRNLPPQLAKLAPRLFASTSLVGGLTLSSGLWLTGNEPTLHVASGEKIELELDDILLETLPPGAHAISLHGEAEGPGRHELRVSGETRAFTTLESCEEIVPTHAGELAHVIDLNGHAKPRSAMAQPVTGKASDELRICGASIAGGGCGVEPAFPPVLIGSQAQRCVLIGRSPDEVECRDDIGQPTWLIEVSSDVQIQYVDIDPSFAAQLVIEYSPGGVRVRAARPTPEEPAPGAVSPLSIWASEITHAAQQDAVIATGADGVWDAYLQAAMSTNGSVVS